MKTILLCAALLAAPGAAPVQKPRGCTGQTPCIHCVNCRACKHCRPTRRPDGTRVREKTCGVCAPPRIVGNERAHETVCGATTLARLPDLKARAVMTAPAVALNGAL